MPEEWGVFTLSAYAGCRMHKIKWRKRRLRELDYEGPSIQTKLKLPTSLMHGPSKAWEQPYLLCFYDPVFF